MKIAAYATKEMAGRAAAALGAQRIRDAINARKEVNIIVATGASQFELLAALVLEPAIAWDRATVFHLDEYVALPIEHPASFRRYLWERFQRRLPIPLRQMHYIDGEGDAEKECRRLGDLIAAHPIDVCFAGIGENAHLAFNDPPADFTTTAAYLNVALDDACRRQQVREGWFQRIEEVPTQAISMSIPQILKSKCVVITAPDERKAKAVRAVVEGPVAASVPASVLQRHPDAALFLDAASARLLSQPPPHELV